MIGISPKLKGYYYLSDAIRLIMDDPGTHIFEEIARRHDKTSESVNRAMQNAINKTWSTADTDELLANYTAKFDIKRGCPSVMEFVYYYANKIKKQF
jgi:hypothetical protein